MHPRNKYSPIPLTDHDRQRLSATLAIPESQLITEEQHFLESTGCPADELEAWLAESWVQHNIPAVLAGTESAGGWPELLAGADGTVRLFSPSEKCTALIQSQPVSDAGSQSFCALDASNSRSQIGAQESGIGRLVGEPPNRGESNVDG